MTQVRVNIAPVGQILESRGLLPGGRAQMVFAEELLRRGDRRTPKQEGDLLLSGMILNGGRAIHYPEPYARYQWYGVAMEGSPPMHPTNRPLQYQEAPLRGKEWLMRTMQEEGEQITEAVAAAAGGRVV